MALLVNLIVAVVVTLILRAMKVADGVDGTAETDYTAEREDPTRPRPARPAVREPLAARRRERPAAARPLTEATTRARCLRRAGPSPARALGALGARR